MKDSNEKLIKQVENDIENQLGESIKVIKTEIRDYIRELDNMKERATERYENFFGKKKILDYLIIINLGITPFLFILVIYFIMTK